MDTATQAGGGAQVYQTAAALIQRANPQLANTPRGADTSATLAAMLQQHQDATGAPAPHENLVNTPPTPETVRCAYQSAWTTVPQCIVQTLVLALHSTRPGLAFNASGQPSDGSAERASLQCSTWPAGDS